MVELIIIPLQAILGRMSGGGLGAKHLDKINATWLPELLFAIPFGYVAFQSFGGNIFAGILAGLWSYIFMQTGHGNVLMGQFGTREVVMARKNTLDKIIPDRMERGSFWYCWIFLFIKGTAIGLPLGLYAPLLGILWASGYYLGFKYKGYYYKGTFHEIPATWEWYSSAGAGLVLWLAL